MSEPSVNEQPAGPGAIAHNTGEKLATGPSSTGPKVSIIIPCYNASTTFMRALLSAEAQTYRNFEIIAVDDRSQDGTAALLQACAEQKRLRFLALPENTGVARARNHAAAAATGEYFAFLDADDEWSPEKLERQVAVLQARPDVGLVGCYLHFNLLSGAREIVNGNHAPPVGPDAWRDLLRYAFYVPSCIMTRRALFEAIGGFDPEAIMCEDQVFAIAVSAISEIACVAELLGTMHQQSSSVSVVNRVSDAERVLRRIMNAMSAFEDRLTRADIRAIKANRYKETGMRLLRSRPGAGLNYLARAVLLGADIVDTSSFVISHLPGVARLKRRFPGAVEAMRGTLLRQQARH